MLSEQFISNVIGRLDRLNPRQVRSFTLDLLEDRNLFHKILSFIHEGILVIDQDQSVRYITPAALSSLGLSAPRIIGQGFADALPEDLKVLIMDALSTASKKKTEVSIVIGPPHNKEITIRRLSLPISSPSLLKDRIFLITDCTAEVLKDKQLKILEQQAMVSRMASAVAHEIKNPLSALSIHVELLERYLSALPEDNHAPFKRTLGILSEEIQRLASIVQEFLFSARPLALRRQTINVNKLIQQLVELVEPGFLSQHIHLSFYPASLDTQISADHDLLKTAFLNLINNAREACHQGDDVKIRIIVKNTEDPIIIYIEDTGHGIPSDILTKIFEPYFTTKGMGTGLGLTLTYRIIREHEGDIHVNSNPNTGTTFRLTLPRFGREGRSLPPRKL